MLFLFATYSRLFEGCRLESCFLIVWAVCGVKYISYISKVIVILRGWACWVGWFGGIVCFWV